ncbi:hypothetical protein GX51_07743 [Blastomyces parvus]|uniref:Uncharacterized protein n=1 Tax=Blastomyces parvus TaxID=2060905 RepID=A0A2B7WJA2_9EURO|nr:hypothetical protein GX51_07743 [Blastomyces parvus]
MSFYFEREQESQRGRFPPRRSTPADWASRSRHPIQSIPSATRGNDSSWFISDVESDEAHQEEDVYWPPSARSSPERYTFDSLIEDLPDSSPCTCLTCSRIQRPNPGTHIQGAACVRNPQAHDRDLHGGSRRRCRHENPRRTMNPFLSECSDDNSPEITTTTGDGILDSDDALMNANNAPANPSRNAPGQISCSVSWRTRRWSLDRWLGIGANEDNKDGVDRWIKGLVEAIMVTLVLEMNLASLCGGCMNNRATSPPFQRAFFVVSQITFR